jgi:YidC/Oxa1 family membrane protein insertase
METRQLFLFIALSVIVLLLWQAWEQEHAPAPPAPVPARQELPAAPAAPTAPSATTPTPTVENGQRVTVTTDLIKAEIDTVGGDLRALYLLDYPVDKAHKDQPYALLTDQPNDVFIAQSGLLGRDGTYPTHKSMYKAEQTTYRLSPQQDQIQVPLSWSEDGLKVTKIYTFRRNSYEVDISYAITNTGSAPREAYTYGQFLRRHIEQHSYFNFVPSYIGGVYYTPDKKYQKAAFKAMAETPLKREASDGWVGVSEHYFVGTWIPPMKVTTEFYSDAQPDNRYVIGFKSLSPVRIAPGATSTASERMYLGPKEQARLKQVAPGMLLTVDYGWLTVIATPLYWVLEQIQHLLRNWGWSIVVLTVLIKLVFFPLSAASYKSMAQMRKLQPRLATMKERYGDDRARLNQAMMELYKTEKINPLGGCLPIVVQIPVFIALYWVLLESVELRQASWMLWIQDLSAPDPYFVLPIIMGVTMLGQQLLNPSPLDPIQKKVMMALPVVFTVFFLFFPAGLVLYWVVNNILSIAQQWWITQRLGGATK